MGEALVAGDCAAASITGRVVWGAVTVAGDPAIGLRFLETRERLRRGPGVKPVALELLWEDEVLVRRWSCGFERVSIWSAGGGRVSSASNTEAMDFWIKVGETESSAPPRLEDGE